MASTAVQQPNVSDYLSKKQRESAQDLAAEWTEIEELHNKKFVDFCFESVITYKSISL